jgi:N-methylhydantoinase B/oxoprolinase/acetone carboxylase alpha subunit
MTIVSNYLRNACHEMGVSMMKTAFSPIFNEGLDFSCVIFDSDGRALAAGEFCPAQIGASLFTVEWCLKELGADTIGEGDVIIHNDPYRGGCHIPEHLLLKPVFVDGRRVAFVANLAHLTEIGGKAPGGFAADATDVFQEGLRLPPVRLVEAGVANEDVWNILLTNHRTPTTTWGDLHAMIGSLNVGERRVQTLFDKYGHSTVTRLGGALLDYSEARMRAEITRIPDGRYAFEDVIENDGVNPSRQYWMRVDIFVDGDEIFFDFRDSDDQAEGPCNCTFGVTASAAYNAMLHLTAPDIPRNAGCFRPIKVLLRPGSVLNVAAPAPEVGGNSEIAPRIVDVIFAALSSALPDRTPASSGGTGCNFLFGGTHPQTGEYYTNYHLEGCGWGALAGADGNSAQGVSNGNCRNTPIEVFEVRFPWRVHHLRLVPDSGGAGTYRGGLATERLLEVVAEEIVVSEFADRTETRPWGLFGGQPGASAATLVKRAGADRFTTFGEAFGTASNTKFSGIRLRKGDQVIIRTAGGGGYGDPSMRDEDALKNDIAEGLVSTAAARLEYGAEVT